MNEVVLYLDEAAGDAVAAAATFLEERGATIGDRSPLSVAFEDGAQIAAVPVQLKPGWCRVWVSTWGSAEAVRLANEYVSGNRERSRRVEQEVKALEASVYSEGAWPEYEARLRRSLPELGAAEMEARITALKRRWLALGKKASASPEEHLSAQ